MFITELEMRLSSLVVGVKTYESDTFSAEGSKITSREAQEVVIKLLNHWENNHLDGAIIDSFLYDIREQKNG